MQFIDNETLHNIVRNAPIGVCIVDATTLISETINDEFLEVVGKPYEAIHGRNYWDAFAEARGLFESHMVRAAAGETIHAEETEIPRIREGKEETIIVNFVYAPVKDMAGKVIKIAVWVLENTVQVNARDRMADALNEELATTNEELAASNEELLTTNEELQQAQNSLARSIDELEEKVINRTKALTASERNTRNIVANAPFPIGVYRGREMLIELANQAIIDVWGKGNDIIGKRYADVLPELADQNVFIQLDNVFTTGVALHIRNQRIDLMTAGKLKTYYFNYSFTPLTNEAGNIYGVMNTAADVTDIVLAKHEVEQGQENLRNMVRQAPVGMCIVRGNPLFVDEINDVFLEIVGKERRQFTDKAYWKVIPEAAAYYEPITDHVMATGETYQAVEHEIMLVRKGKPETVFVDFVYEPIREEGKVTAIMIVAIEVTEKIKARKIMEDSAEELAAINEELAASNEEMTATNDELAAVNEELIQTQMKLEDSEDQLRFTLNAIPVQVWTATPEGALNYVNQVICEDFGYNAEEIVGHGWQEFIHPDDLGNCLEKWMRSLQSGQEYVVEFRLKFGDGIYYWHLARAVPFSEDGKIKLWLGTNTNIDLRKKNEQQKDEFLSIASHELKTPLTSIKLYNQLINRAKDEQQIKTFAGKTTDHILRLERLISDLLDVSKINAGKMSYTLENFEFDQMIIDSVETLKPVAKQDIVIESNAAVTYIGDRFRLEQVMSNFLSNAIKYSPDAKNIFVKAVVEHESIIVSVQDFGIGIDRESIDRLFDRYFRADNAAMRFDGLGLGLFISSEIIKRHNGSFWIESEQGKGSTFYFRLPLEKAQVAQAPVITPTSYRHETLTIDYLPDAKRIEVDWTGFQDLASVKAGCLAILDMVNQTKCDRIVNDNTHVLGNWSEATEWVGNEWFPMMEKAGLKYFAHIFSPSTFSQLAAQKSIDIMAGIITTQYFTDVELAREWIDHCPR